MLAQNIPMVITGRAVKGFSVGIFSASLPVYVSEIFPQNKKGLGTSVMQWSLTWGIMLMFYISYFCNLLGDEKAFRIAWGIEIAPAVSLLVGTIFLPESPKWLATGSRWEEADHILEKLGIQPENRMGNQGDQDEDDLRNRVGLIDMYDSTGSKCTYLDLFRKDLRKHLLVGITTQLFTQLSGIGVLMYYLVYICQMVGLSGEVKILSASIQYVINVLFTIFPILWLDKMRRKDVLVFGATFLGTCISTIGAIMGWYGHGVPPIDGHESIVWEVTGTPGSLCLALCFLFVAVFASTLSCAGWLYTNEILPLRAKAKGSAICMSVSWTVNFTLTFLTPLSMKHIRWFTFLIFGFFCISGALIMGFLFPETYGLSDEQIRNLFVNKDQNVHDEGSIENERPVAVGHDSSPTEAAENDYVVVNEDHEMADNVGVGTSVKNPVASDRSYKLSIPSHVNELHHNIIQRTHSTTDSSTRITEGVSPFLKKMGGPFETYSDLSALEQNVDGTGSPDNSTTYTDGIIGHYYNQRTNDSPFMNHHNSGSPFR